MRVFISVDMEGATGICHPEDTMPDGADYATARRFMTSDADAAVKGSFDSGATDVVVNDAHWTGRNLLLADLDPRARLIRGFHKPMCMMQGLDNSFDAVVFVGYHACAGTEGGVLNHTLLGKEIHDVLIDGEPAGELRLNALIAGELGIPVVFVSGDDAACAEASRVLGNEVPVAAVKDGIDMLTASCLHPEVTRRLIQDGVVAGLETLGDRHVYDADGERTYSIEWSTTTMASASAYVPRVSLSSPRLTGFVSGSPAEAMKIIMAQLFITLQLNVPFYS